MNNQDEATKTDPFWNLFESVRKEGLPSPSVEFGDKAKIFFDNQEIFGSTSIAYSRKGTPRIRTSGDTAANQHALGVDDPFKATEIRWKGRSPSTPTICIERKFNSEGDFWVTVVPRVTPVSVGNGHAAKITGIILNGPDTAGRDLDFFPSDNRVSCRICPETLSDRDRKERREEGIEYIPTSSIEFSRSSDQVDWEEALDVSKEIWVFFQFVTGRSVGVGGHIGQDSDGAVPAIQLGFLRSDPDERTNNWYDWTLSSNLPEMFAVFSEAYNKSGNLRNVFATTFGLYRSSERVRSSAGLEVAITTTHTCLETLVNHILADEAGWSKGLLGSKVPFHDKLRAAASFVAVDAELLEHAPLVRDRAKSFNNVDGYEMLSIYRNRFVHSGREFSYDGLELHQAWEYGQWLCELLIFHLLKYRGKMADRRNTSRFLGTTVDVPLGARA